LFYRKARGKMKAVYVTKVFDPISNSPGVVECLDVPVPEPAKPDDVLIRVAYAAICGSDAHYIKDNLFPFEPPFAVGHEFSGTIAALADGAKQRGFAVGDRVTGNFVLECGFCSACRNGKRQFCENASANGAAQAEYLLLDARQIYKLPDDVPLLDAALIEPFVIASGVMDKAELALGQSLLVLGAGSIGQMLVQLANRCSASLVAAAARSAHKCEAALNNGAHVVINSAKEDIYQRVRDISGHGFDVVLEASGNPQCITQALDLAAPGGTVVFLSYYPPEQPVSIDVFKQIVLRELTVKGVQLSQNNWPRALRMFSRVDVRPLVTSIYPLEEAKAAYAELVAGKAFKIVFDCGAKCGSKHDNNRASEDALVGGAVGASADASADALVGGAVGGADKYQNNVANCDFPSDSERP
jgi:(R,R)-butanediol dehydrogenase/meso-butanediol dehydrogenase/diacetyl reductase/L-iditol 2-dehydrogenase